MNEDLRTKGVSSKLLIRIKFFFTFDVKTFYDVDYQRIETINFKHTIRDSHTYTHLILH